MTPYDLIEVLKAVYPRYIEQRLGKTSGGEVFPVWVWGPPGVGKTQAVKQAAKELGIKCITIQLQLRDPTDLRGIPVPDFERGVAVWLASEELPPPDDDQGGLLFFDEMADAPPLVQSTATQIVIPPHKLAEYRLPPKWYPVAASNRPEDGALARAIPTHLANRFHHVEVLPDLDAWCRWAYQAEIDPTIIAFLRYRPEITIRTSDGKEKTVSTLCAVDTTRQSRAFPTPRSWAAVSQLLNWAPQHLLPELVKGTVGEGVGIEFLAYREVQDQIPNLDRIMKGENIIPERPDVLYATVAGLVSRAAKDHDTFPRLLDYAVAMHGRSLAEFGLLLIKELLALDKQRVIRAPNVQSIIDAFGELVW